MRVIFSYLVRQFCMVFLVWPVPLEAGAHCGKKAHDGDGAGDGRRGVLARGRLSDWNAQLWLGRGRGALGVRVALGLGARPGSGVVWGSASWRGLV